MLCDIYTVSLLHLKTPLQSELYGLDWVVFFFIRTPKSENANRKKS